ncbi:MAG: hypothetical protein FWD66_05745 [Paludibacter sp.]|nr:hypothetical protein [Paludibacter sp.]
MRKFSFFFSVILIVTILFSSCGKDDEPNPLTYDAGVVINGVKWATRNVDKPGTFASTPESAGMFYQWNRKIGWSAIDPMVNSNGGTEWDATYHNSTWEWEQANDPCPQGWRIPTLDEVKTLFNSGKVKHELVEQNGVFGIKFTDKNTGNNLFLPAAGDRGSSIGKLYDVGVYGYYWSNMQYNDMYAYSIFFNSDYNLLDIVNRRAGLSLRAVAQ